MRLVRGLLIVLSSSALLLSTSTTFPARIVEAQSQRRQAPPLDEKLADVGEKLYELNLRVPFLFMHAYQKEEGAGEGLYPRLFNDATTVLELALEKNEHNHRARLLLGKSYFAKSRRGEGRWSEKLITKAEANFKRALTDSRTPGLTPQQLAEARQALEDIRKIREGQGELVE